MFGEEVLTGVNVLLTGGKVLLTGGKVLLTSGEVLWASGKVLSALWKVFLTSAKNEFLIAGNVALGYKPSPTSKVLLTSEEVPMAGTTVLMSSS